MYRTPTPGIDTPWIYNTRRELLQVYLASIAAASVAYEAPAVHMQSVNQKFRVEKREIVW